MSKKLSSVAFNIGSCVISYISLCIIALLRTLKHFQNLPNTVFVNSGLSILFCIVCGSLFTLALCSDKIKNLIVDVFHITTNNNVFDDTIDYKNGSSVTVYLKDKDYYITGNFRATDEGKDKQYLVLNMFAKWTLEHEIIEDYNVNKNPENANIIIKFEDIDYIQVFNNHYGQNEKNDKTSTGDNN